MCHPQSPLRSCSLTPTPLTPEAIVARLFAFPNGRVWGMFLSKAKKRITWVAHYHASLSQLLPCFRKQETNCGREWGSPDPQQLWGVARAQDGFHWVSGPAVPSCAPGCRGPYDGYDFLSELNRHRLRGLTFLPGLWIHKHVHFMQGLACSQTVGLETGTVWTEAAWLPCALCPKP